MISPLGNQNKKLLVVIIMLYCYLFKLLSSLVNKSFHSLSYFYYHCCLGVRNANSTLYFFIIDSIFFFSKLQIFSWSYFLFDEFFS